MDNFFSTLMLTLKNTIFMKKRKKKKKKKKKNLEVQFKTRSVM